jgi:regulation of enolase protein 1 (concanavalin A-like superfamily)
LIKGSSICSNNKFLINASGDDIWNNSDNFHYTYQYIDGDCEIYTIVESIENTNPWAKAGVMIRETLDGNSKNAFLGMTTENGATFQRRFNKADGSEGLGNIAQKSVPYWIKLIRKDNNFTSLISPNGKSWVQVGNTEVPMSKKVYVGLCVTSHDNSKVCKAVYSNYVLKGRAAKLE